MHITGIIAEYNPLHAGHQYHIEQTKALTGADYMITVLSGDFVQRGLPAVLDKHTRAHMALEAGSDLVLELPVPYALSSGEGFGFGGVSLLHQLGCVDTLSFGTEAGVLDKLTAIAKVLTAESPAYRQAYQKALKQGLTHPAARLQAMQEACPELDLTVLEGHSNNMLALEYCKALYRLDSSIQPVTVKRLGQEYLEDAINPGEHLDGVPVFGFASATAIREALNQTCLQIADLSALVPHATAAILEKTHTENSLLFPDDFSNLLHYKLLCLSGDKLTNYWEVTPDFTNKISKQLAAFKSFNQFSNLLWTKEMTYARVCRTLMHILLDIKVDTWDVHRPVPYARVLGFRKDSAPLLSEIKKNSSIPLITKLADAEKLLSPEAYQLLCLDMKAAHIYDSVLQQKSHTKIMHEMQKQIVII